MLNFKPLKTKALKPQGNITRKRRTFNTIDLSLKLSFNGAPLHANTKNLFDEL